MKFLASKPLSNCLPSGGFFSSRQRTSSSGSHFYILPPPFVLTPASKACAEPAARLVLFLESALADVQPRTIDFNRPGLQAEEVFKTLVPQINKSSNPSTRLDT